MAFQFSLEPVLEYRKVIEEKRQRELSQALDALSKLETEKQSLMGGLDKNRDELRRALREGQSYANRLLFENWLNWADARLSRLEGELRTRRAEAEKRRRALAEAAKQTMIMDKLKEHERTEWQRSADRAEQRMFDEVALREFAAARREQEEKVAERQERNAR